MSFLASPPEIISSSLYGGAGSAPMLAVSAAWGELAAELGSAAQSFSSVTSGLAGQAWQGPASAAMVSTAARYTGVLTAAATQAQTAAVQAQTVASAFESALAATIHPALVAANRNQLTRLVVSNLFGQNAPAIAATEADYEQMWAQDVAAMVGYHGGVSVAAAQLPSWQTAAQGVAAQLSGAVAKTEQSAQAVVGQTQQAVVNVVNGSAEVLVGHPLIGGATNTATGGGPGSGATGQATTSLPSNSVPITMHKQIVPTVNISVNGGPTVTALLDTGARGTAIPFTDVGGLLGLLQLGLPSGFGTGSYGGGQINYLYGTWNMSVNLGDGIVTAPTPTAVELIAWPGSLQFAMTHGWTWQSMWASNGVTAVLGVGPNAPGPTSTSPITALPAPLNQGVLINQAGGYAEFGPNPLTPIATLTGAPYTTLEVSVNGGPLQSVYSNIDSGGAYGWIPSSIAGSAPVGTPFSVYAPGDPTPLYTSTVGGSVVGQQPVTSQNDLNTGNYPFAQNPVYISNSPSGVGTTVVDAPA